jgi:hypothetical protein
VIALIDPGLVALIGVILTPISLFSVGWLTARSAAKLAAQQQSTHSLVENVDRAVNNKPAGEQTMASQVDDLHKAMPTAPSPEPLRAVVDRMAEQLAALSDRLNELPP